MNLNDIVFIESLPTIDLHGLDRDSARVFVEQFVQENYLMKNKFVVIIHGVGSHILRNETHDFLKKSKKVRDFKLYYNNVGCTVVELNI